jgi:transposase
MVERGPCERPQHQKEKRSREHFAGLDVSVKETSVCIVDRTGKIVRQVMRVGLYRPVHVKTLV